MFLKLGGKNTRKLSLAMLYCFWDVEMVGIWGCVPGIDRVQPKFFKGWWVGDVNSNNNNENKYYKLIIYYKHL